MKKPVFPSTITSGAGATPIKKAAAGRAKQMSCGQLVPLVGANKTTLVTRLNAGDVLIPIATSITDVMMLRLLF